MMKWLGWESGTYPIHSLMPRVFYLPQHRTLSRSHPLALRHMRSTSCWVSADERWYWKSWAPLPGFGPLPSAQQASILTTRPLNIRVIFHVTTQILQLENFALHKGVSPRPLTIPVWRKDTKRVAILWLFTFIISQKLTANVCPYEWVKKNWELQLLNNWQKV